MVLDRTEIDALAKDCIVINLKLRLDDLMKDGRLSAKKKHMKEIKTCGGEYDV